MFDDGQISLHPQRRKTITVVVSIAKNLLTLFRIQKLNVGATTHMDESTWNVFFTLSHTVARHLHYRNVNAQGFETAKRITCYAVHPVGRNARQSEKHEQENERP